MKNEGTANVTNHKVVSHEEWLAERKALLAKEKEFNRLRDELSAERRALSWERVEKAYVFERADGKKSLGDLFEGRSQLVMYQAMFNPETATDRTPWTKDAACKSCSFWLEHLDGIAIHLAHRDVTLIAVSRAPLAAIDAYRKRMGWRFTWVSSTGTDFNHDYGVALTADEIANKTGIYNYAQGGYGIAELPGISVFYKDSAGALFHTYSTYSRGLDMLNVGYHYLDIVPRGRDEKDGNMSWLRRRDEYETGAKPHCH